MVETIFYSFVLVLGLLLLFYRPISRLFGVSTAWEIGAGTLLVIVFVFYITSTYIIAGEIEKDLAMKPCGEKSPQGTCYKLEQKLCETAWSNAEGPCRDELAPLVKARPGALLGPSLNRCKARKMDQVFRFNRANTNTAYCKAYFRYVEE